MESITANMVIVAEATLWESNKSGHLKLSETWDFEVLISKYPWNITGYVFFNLQQWQIMIQEACYYTLALDFQDKTWKYLETDLFAWVLLLLIADTFTVCHRFL